MRKYSSSTVERKFIFNRSMTANKLCMLYTLKASFVRSNKIIVSGKKNQSVLNRGKTSCGQAL